MMTERKEREFRRGEREKRGTFKIHTKKCNACFDDPILLLMLDRKQANSNGCLGRYCC